MHPHTLVDFYESILYTHGPSSISARVCMLCALVLVHQGNRKPGHLILAGAFAAHFLISSFICWGDLGVLRLVSLAALVPGIACAVQTFKGGFAFRILPNDEPWKSVAIAAIAVAFVYPFWPRVSIVRGFLFSPMGVIPQPTLLLMMVLLTYNRDRVAGWMLPMTGALVLILGGIDVVAGNRGLGVVALVYLATCGTMIMMGNRGGGTTGDAPPPAGPSPRDPMRRPAIRDDKAPASGSEEPPKRRWDIR